MPSRVVRAATRRPPRRAGKRDILAGTGWPEHVPFLAAGKHRELLENVACRRAAGETVYPPQADLLRAFAETPWDSVRAIILGQDPYHGAGQAHGLAFSVPDGVRVPPSLRNILKEVVRDVYGDAPPPSLSPDLTRWARQGVLLLNTVFSVTAGRAHSHASLGWQALTRAVLESLAAGGRPLAVLLWGSPAGAFAPLFANGGHLVLCAAHPSPLSASRGFLGCGHFSQVNAWLRERGQSTIIW